MISVNENWQGRFYRTLFLLFLTQAALILVSPLDLSGDEAHYWEWSNRLDWAYYSKGPAVAFLIKLSTAIFGDNHFGVRAVALFSMAACCVVMFNYISRYSGHRAAFLSLLMLCSMPMFFSMGVITTTDPLTALTVVLCFDSLDRAQRNYRWWLPAFLFAGFAVLTKYTAALLLVVLLATAIKRRQLKRWEFWSGLLLFAICLAPVVIWNAQHGWVNFAHNAGHVAARGFKPQYLLELIGSQLGLAGPIVFVVLVSTVLTAARRWREDNLFPLLLFVVLLSGICLFVSMTKRVYANWPMPVLLSSTVLFGMVYNDFGHGVLRWFKRGVVLNSLFILTAATLFLGLTFGVPGEYLPTKKLVGFQELSVNLQSYIRADDFVLAESYDIASAVAFYSKIPGRVFCGYVDDRRMNQYDIWGGWEKLRGRDAVLVLKHRESLARVQDSFSNVIPLGEVPIYFGIWELRRYYLFRGEGFSGNAPPLPAKR